MNTTGATVTVSWLNGDGDRAECGTVKPGESYTQDTYNGHFWVVAGADGSALAVFQPTTPLSRAVIR